jgi:hypothetical protein
VLSDHLVDQFTIMIYFKLLLMTLFFNVCEIMVVHHIANITSTLRIMRSRYIYLRLLLWILLTLAEYIKLFLGMRVVEVEEMLVILVLFTMTN